MSEHIEITKGNKYSIASYDPISMYRNISSVYLTSILTKKRCKKRHPTKALIKAIKIMTTNNRIKFRGIMV